jgi:pimeloyl-ACP methyl ester carboxylesterase
MIETPGHPASKQQTVDLDDAQLEVFRVDNGAGAMVIAAAHPASAFGADTASLLADTARADVVCINPRGLGRSSPAGRASLEEMVDDLERVRGRLGLGRWMFWGMSGGGWLAQIYARRHPDALVGIIVESACACFRNRLADPACILSPFFPAWRGALYACGLLREGSHASPSADDTEWMDLEGVGQVLRRPGGPALLVSPMLVDHDLKRAMPMLWAFDSREWLIDVRTPTLVIAGTADLIAPGHRVREVHERIRGSTLVMVEGGGHVPSAERRSGAVTAVRRFVAARAREPVNG